MITVFATIFVLGVLIFIHELGHFSVAKGLGIRVEKFSLGFPPKLVGKKIGETEYLISWLPLGGYVRMAGDNPEQPLTGASWEFLSRPRWQRSLVIIAGPAMNYIFAIVLVWLILMIGGIGTFDAVIGQVDEGSVGERMGLMPGDRVVSINGQDISTWDEIYDALPEGEGQVIILVERGDHKEELTIELPALSTDGQDELGILPLFTTQVGEVEKGGPAYEAGIRSGDIIEAIDGIKVERWSDMVSLIQAQPDSIISVRWRRGAQIHQAEIQTKAMKIPNEAGELETRGFVGITSRIIQKRIDILEAAGESFRWTFGTTEQIALFIKGLVTGEVSARMVGGPIFIAQTAGQSARQGFTTLLYFMALLSVNLAILNVLPIPILDGGQLLILLVEKAKGGSLSQKQRMIVQQIGLALIALLIVFVFFNDVTR